MLKHARGLHRGIWVLGFVSLLMDVSSELIHSLLPLFMVAELGAGGLAVGLVEGVADATALCTKVLSGTFSDRFGKRKGPALLGYLLSALSKPLFPLAGSVTAVLAARFLDRIGKGIRGAPRDALIADLAPEGQRGAAYGLRQSLDTVGAVLGPILGIVLMVAFSGRYRVVFWFAVLPAALSAALLAAGVQEPEPAKRPTAAGEAFHGSMLSGLGEAYWRVVAVGAVFSLARFSEAFLILRARQTGLPDAWAPAALVLLSVVYALSAYPAGRLADRFDRRWLLGGGMLALIAADLALARADGLALAAAGTALWGLHLGLTQGVLAAMVAASSPGHRRGTAFGFFNLASGAAMLAASLLAGWLSDRYGMPAAFYAGAGWAGAALLLLAGLNR